MSRLCRHAPGSHDPTLDRQVKSNTVFGESPLSVGVEAEEQKGLVAVRAASNPRNPGEGGSATKHGDFAPIDSEQQSASNRAEFGCHVPLGVNVYRHAVW